MINIANDYFVFDASKLVTIFHRNGTTEGVIGCRVPVDEAENAATQGVVLKWDTDYYLPSNMVSPVELGDIIDDSEYLWTVIESKPPIYADNYYCTCKQLGLSLNYTDTITIVSKDELLDTWTGRVISDKTIASNIPARVQPITNQIVDKLGRRLFVQQWYVYVMGDYSLQFGDAVICNGVRYKVVGWTARKSFEDQMEIITELMV